MIWDLVTQAGLKVPGGLGGETLGAGVGNRAHRGYNGSRQQHLSFG